MSKENIITTIVTIVFIIVVGVFSFYRSLGEEPANVLNDLKETTGLAFSDQKKSEFSWMIEENGEVKEVIIKGQKIEVKGISTEDHNKLTEFFSDFEINEYNVSAGTVIGLTGYQKDEVICVIIEENAIEGECLQANKLNDDGSLIESLSNVVVKCGQLKNYSYFEEVGEILDEVVMEVNEGEKFKIVLKTNVSAGYQWQPDYDYEYIEIFDVSYTNPKTEIYGASGELVFHLKALQKGEKVITFSYIRAWEEKAPTKKVDYKIIIE